MTYLEYRQLFIKSGIHPMKYVDWLELDNANL